MDLALKDKSALEGTPLKLMIVVAMIALSAPPLYGALGNFQETASINSIRAQVEELVMMIKELIKMGPGSKRTVEIRIPSDGSYLIIGGASISESMSIGYGLKGDRPTRYYLTDPNVTFSTPSEEGLRIDGPGCEICLRCIEKNGSILVQVMI